ncbi:winged helix-turn-helix domain-containing protein [Variovorax ureilyticus]|uniref:Winged helix-turn-helix domain-containing protein n=1 Tax=Variovorax ureilyticus TaxID=1836198 RepID=A0ABU8VGP3_9BURK
MGSSGRCSRLKNSPRPQSFSPLVNSLADQIVAMIRREGFEVGHRLTEQRLSSELGVSRSPVRKALQFLQTAGVVRSQPNKGFQVGVTPREFGTWTLPKLEGSDEAI